MPDRSALARVIVLAVAIAAPACAPQLNAQQQRTWDAYKACQAQGPSTLLERVEPSGRAHILGREGEVYKVGACMDEYRQKTKLPGVLEVTPAPNRPDALVVREAPLWVKGDEWRFSVTTASGGKSTYTWRVDREEIVEGVPYYVVKRGAADIFHRKSDLAFSHEIRNGEVTMRNTPPRVEYVWPLGVGASWTQTYHHERPAAGTAYNTGKASSVEREETITVPAGTFRTLKIVHRNRPGDAAVQWEEWYAPEVRMWVRQHEPSLKEGPRMRELVSFTPAAKVAERRSP